MPVSRRLTVYVLQAFARHAVVGAEVLVTEEGSCSGQVLTIALPNAFVLQGEVTKCYLWVIERLLVGRKARWCSAKLKMASLEG